MIWPFYCSNISFERDRVLWNFIYFNILLTHWKSRKKKTHLMDCTGNGLKKRRKLELHFVVYLHFSFQIDPWHKQVKEQISTFFPPVPCRLHKWKTSASKKQCHYSINKISPLICEFLVGARWLHPVLICVEYRFCK